ncbi:MAG: hypothetical protein WCV88_01000 [Patescibacteria group bacterium]
MQPYKNLSGQSGVKAYEYGTNYIVVQFKTQNISDGCDTYEYTYRSAGAMCVNDMKHCADLGAGLNSYINLHVQKLYANKW